MVIRLSEWPNSHHNHNINNFNTYSVYGYTYLIPHRYDLKKRSNLAIRYTHPCVACKPGILYKNRGTYLYIQIIKNS